jgi:cell division protein FtsZ
MPEFKPSIETSAKIKVVGVGGGGGNAINRMIEAGIRGVEFISINTDVQALQNSRASNKLNIGKTITKGLGAGMDPEVGRKAAEESQNEIRDVLKGADMVFIACGLGGGTGTGASPVVAEIAKELGALTIAVVTKPFFFEGENRKKVAEEGYDVLSDKVDTIIVVSNEKLLEIIDERTTFVDSFKTADNILLQGVQGISEIITVPGIINADFADVRAVMLGTGSALMGVGQASGDNKAVDAVNSAINSALLETSMEGAKGVVYTITGGADLSMADINNASKMISSLADEEAKIIFGAVIDESLGDEIKVTVVATGFDDKESRTMTRKDFQAKKEDNDYFSFMKKEEVEKQDDSEEKDPKKSLFNFNSKKIFNKEKIEKDSDKNKKKPSIQGNKKEKDENNDLDDLDVPAFLRNKMKK